MLNKCIFTLKSIREQYSIHSKLVLHKEARMIILNEIYILILRYISI
jgi:hypothetical protein